MSFDAIQWIQAKLQPKHATSVQLIYDHAESQSGFKLPVIYQPFDPDDRGHFVDRARILDFVLSAGKGTVLDFGPGDGWPSLLMAPMLRQVTGIDGSERRVRVCQQNAARLGIDNASFIHVQTGQPLPFADQTFDGATAASSLEQTPDPRAALAEIYRVLKPGGKLRMDYESLSFYRGGREREMSLWQIEPQRTMLLLFDRRPDEQLVWQYRLLLQLSKAQVVDAFVRHGSAEAQLDSLTEAVLEQLRPRVASAGVCKTRHPSCRTWLAWMQEVDFRSARPTLGGGQFAREMFDAMDAGSRPRDLPSIDHMLRPIVQAAIKMPVPSDAEPGQWEPMIIAEK